MSMLRLAIQFNQYRVGDQHGPSKKWTVEKELWGEASGASLCGLPPEARRPRPVTAKLPDQPRWGRRSMFVRIPWLRFVDRIHLIEPWRRMSV
jgi:hypothetical protein